MNYYKSDKKKSVSSRKVGENSGQFPNQNIKMVTRERCQGFLQVMFVDKTDKYASH